MTATTPRRRARPLTVSLTIVLLAALTGCGGKASVSAPEPAAAAPTSSQGTAWNGGKVKMIIGLSGSAESVEGKAVQKFKELIEQSSQGNMTVDIFPSGQLGTFADMATGLKAGNNHAIFIQPDALGQQINLATANSWPFMLDNQDQMLKAWNGPTGKELVSAIEKESGYRMLAPTWNLPRNVLINRKVTKMSDLAGAKIRVPGTQVYVQQMKALGLSPTPMSINDVYSGMQNGVVEGMEATLADADAQSLADVTKTIVVTRHVLSPKMWLFSGKWLDGLSPAARDAVVTAAQGASDWYSTTLKADEQRLTQKFKDKGAVFVEPDWSRDEMRAKTAGLKQSLGDLAPWAEKLSAGSR